MKKRLDVHIDANARDFIERESERTGRPMNAVADELLSHAIAARQGEIIEEQSLPVIRAIVQAELGKALAQLRADLQEDMSLEFTNEFKATTRASANRLAALIVKTVRDANIARRLMFTVLAKAYGADFALKAYEDASQKAGRDLANRADREDSTSC